MCFMCPIRKRIEEIAEELGVLLAETHLYGSEIQQLINGEMTALGLVATKTAVNHSAKMTLESSDTPEHEKAKIRIILETLEMIDATGNATNADPDTQLIAAYSPVKGDKQLN